MPEEDVARGGVIRLGGGGGGGRCILLYDAPGGSDELSDPTEWVDLLSSLATTSLPCPYPPPLPSSFDKL